MLKKILLTGATCAAFAGCAANGPTFSAWEHRQPDGSSIYEVDCHGLFDSEDMCVKRAQKICGNQPVNLVQSGRALGATRYGQGSVPDVRQLLFRCGVPESAAPAPVAPAPAPAPVPVPVPMVQHVRLNGDVSFDTNKAVLKPAARDTLDALIARSADESFNIVVVNGYTDSRGSARYNLGLSERRAASVAAYLQEHGLKAQHYEAHGFGASHPVATNATRAGRAQNRRVEITLEP